MDTHEKKECIIFQDATLMFMHKMLFTESCTFHRIIGWKRPLRSLSPTIHPTPPCLLNRIWSATSTCFLNTSRDGDSTTSLSSPVQCLTKCPCWCYRSGGCQRAEAGRVVPSALWFCGGTELLQAHRSASAPRKSLGRIPGTVGGSRGQLRLCWPFQCWRLLELLQWWYDECFCDGLVARGLSGV